MPDISGGIDAGIPLQAKAPPPVNPLQTIGQFAGVQNALNQNRLFPGQQQLQQQAVQSGAVGLAQKTNQAAYQAITPLLALPQGEITHSALTSALGSAEGNLGIPTHGVLSDIMSTAPSGDGPEFDQKIRSMIVGRAMTSPESSVAGVTGTPSVMGNGQVNQPGVVAGPGASGFGGFRPTGGGVQQFPSTGQLMGPVQWQDASGTTHYGTAAGYATARGIPGAALGPAVAVPAAAPAAPMGNGHYPVPLSNTTGPAPGTPETSLAQVPGAQATADRVAHYQSDMFPLMQAQKALANAPTGLGSEAAHTASSYLNTFAPPVLQRALSFVSPIMTPEETSAYDEAKKYLTQGQLGTPGATRSNEGLNTAGAASPSTQITKEAAQLVLKGMVALRRMEQDEGQSWLASGLPVSQFNQFRANFQKQADPRVYTFDQMTPTQRQQTVTSIKDPTKRAAFIAAVQRAESNNILSAPSQ